MPTSSCRRYRRPIAPASSKSTFQFCRSDGGQVPRLRREVGVARQRQDGGLHRRQPRVEPQHRAGVDAALGVGRLVLGVGLDQERHQRAGQAGRRLDDVRRPAGVGRLVEVGQVGAGVLGVRLQVEVGAVGDALELAPLRALEAEAVLDVDGALRVVRQLLLRVLEVPQVVRGRCRGRCTSGCARRSSTGATPRRCRARRRTPSPSARTRGCGR